MANFDSIIADLDALTSADKAVLVSMLEERWGIKSSFIPGADQASESSSGFIPVLDKSEFEVVLTGFKDKISVIKEIRAITGLDLKSAKDFVESAPRTVKDGLDRETADAIVGRIQGAGGIAEVK